MALPVRLQGYSTLGEPDILEGTMHKRLKETGPVVFTHPLIDGLPFAKPFVNSEYGADMTQAVTFSGTPEQVHDGIDSVLWTGSQISGSSVTFNSSNRANSGSTSVRADSPSVGDVWQFAKGSTFDPTGYAALTFFVNVNRRWDPDESIEIYGWDTGGGVQVGTRVNLEDYADVFDFDVWHSVVIPIAEFNFTGDFDALRFESAGTVSGGATGDFFVDDMQFEETGDPISFTAEPNGGTIFHATKMVIAIADVGTGGTANAYNKFGALTSLPFGVNVQAQVGGILIFSGSFSDLGEMLSIGWVRETVVDDGTNTFMALSLNFRDTTPVSMQSNKQDFLRVTINDDMSGLLHFTAFVRGVEEAV